MSIYSDLPIYNSIFILLKDLYKRIPKFSKEYKYLLGEKILKCCIESIVLVCRISSIKDKNKRVDLLEEIEDNMNVLLVYIRIANELNQLVKKENYFFLSQQVINILSQIQNWKKFLQKEK